MDQQWSENQVFTMSEHPRQTSALLYFKNCAAVYTLPNGDTVDVKAGSLMYIPQGSLYKTHFYHCGEAAPHTQLIEFELLDDNNEPFVGATGISVLDLSKTYDTAKVVNEIVALYNKPTLSYGMLKSKCYAFLNEICLNLREERICSKKYMPIAKGIAYLEQTSSYTLSIAEIAAMCHVSETYFRRLFEQYSGVSPQRYKNDNLLRQAKDMIRSGDLTIKEIADRLGFSDAGYFSRWFKKNTGITPRKFEAATFDR